MSAADARKVRDSGAEILAEYPNALLVRATGKQRSALESAKLTVAPEADATLHLAGGSFTFSSAVEAQVARRVAVDPNRTSYYLVKLIGPPKGEWLVALEAGGATIQGTISGNVLLIGVRESQLAAIRQKPWVEAVAPYQPAMKVDPSLRAGVDSTLTASRLAAPEVGAAEATEQVEIAIFEGESSEAVADLVRAGGGTVLSTTDDSVTAVIPRQKIAEIAEQPGVQAIIPHRFPELHNDKARKIMKVPDDQIFGEFTLKGTGQVVAIADTGLDSGDPASIHPDFAGRVVDIVNCTNGSPQDTHGHGTHVAGCVLGSGAAATAAGASIVPKGVAPEARVYFQVVGATLEGTSDLKTLFTLAYNVGARIHTNSWGTRSQSRYNGESRRVDRFMFNNRDMLILFSAGNEGEDDDENGVIDEKCIDTPSTAKNCLTVGACENLRPSGSDPALAPEKDITWDRYKRWNKLQCEWPTLGAAGHISNNPSGMAAFSSRGPTKAGRIKPDVVAPGTNILSVRSSAFVALPDKPPYILWGDLSDSHPLYRKYCWSGGTSMSTPLVAGAAALVRQHLTDQRNHIVAGSKPSGALIKAFLINGAASMSPGQFTAVLPALIPAADEIPPEPNFVNGFGRVDLQETLAPDPLGQALFVDEPEYAVVTGDIRIFQVRAVDTSQPIKVTLCWTDAPSHVGGGGLVNRLYLQVIQPGGTLPPLDGDTTPYPTPTNNVQRIVIENPVEGTYEIRVYGNSVTKHSPGAPAGSNPRQDFALVASNAVGEELVFAKFHFTQGDGSGELDTHIDVDTSGAVITKDFKVRVTTIANTFVPESVSLKLTAHKTGGIAETREYRYASAAWSFDPPDPVWAMLAPPTTTTYEYSPATTPVLEGYDIEFTGQLTLDKNYTQLDIEAQIHSSWKDSIVLASAKHTLNIYEKSPLPEGVNWAKSAALPKPRSFVFADMDFLVQDPDTQSFGPVSDTCYQTTSLFTFAPTQTQTGVNAYAVTDGLIMIQPVEGNADAVNLILKPRKDAGIFNGVRYFVYRGLCVDDFLNRADPPLVREAADATDLIAKTRINYLTQNSGETKVPSMVLGYDPDAQDLSKALDSCFFPTNSKFQLLKVTKGDRLGRFLTENGNNFGFEIVLEGSDFKYDLTYARCASHEIDVSNLSKTTAEDLFKLRIEKEKILDFMDPAAFYGLHMCDEGEVQAPGMNDPWTGQKIFDNVISKFATKNKLYVDIRSENGDSLDFYGNYSSDGSEIIQWGTDPNNLAPIPYSTNGWPILIKDMPASAAMVNDYYEVYFKLPVKDNIKPVVYIDHGHPLTPTTKGLFVRDLELLTGTDVWTNVLGFKLPKTEPTDGSTGGPAGVANMLRLIYARQFNDPPTPVPVPDPVLETQSYADNVFGPVGADHRWGATANLKWFGTQRKHYVDASFGPGWKQMMECGTAWQDDTRVLLYANAIDSDFNEAYPFVPPHPILDFISKRNSFFDEPGLFGVYLLEQDVIQDDATEVRTLKLASAPATVYPPTSALLLGLTKTQFDYLKALNGFSADYPRYIVLRNKATIAATSDGISCSKYEVRIQGLNASGMFHVLPTQTDPIYAYAYTIDGQFFYTAEFSKLEPLPESYERNYEEEKGARQLPAVEKRIASIVGDTITIENYDWTRDIVPRDIIDISKSKDNDGRYQVVEIHLSVSGSDTVIKVDGTLNSTSDTNLPWGSVFSIPKAVEDYYIDLDQGGGMRLLVNGFRQAIVEVNDVYGLLDQVSYYAQMILQLTRTLSAADQAHSDDYERMLYWTRLRMLVELKGHPFCLASLSGRNKLVNSFEEKSRGYYVDFSGAAETAKKILIIGFDPYGLASDLNGTSPSASVALALAGQPISTGGKTAHVESVIFPMRYRDFDAGRVEDLLTPLQDSVGMVISIGQQPKDEYHLEQFAGRRRAGWPDNEFVSMPEKWLGDDTYAEFYEATLPPGTQVPDSFIVDPNKKTKKRPSSNVDVADEGSGGCFLYNEAFYRVAHCLLDKCPKTVFIQVPPTECVNGGISKIIENITAFILSELDSNAW